MRPEFDLAVIGGGINGCGIARDAAGRGLKTLLLERGDFAGGTSSASTKLIHGGLRYLEHYEFRMVREALKEREVLLRAAPHIIWPMRFVLPHQPGLRPSWLVRLGLMLYDGLGGREILPGSRGLDLRAHPAGAPLRPGLAKAFEYSDCWVEDSRLVVLNAVDAADRGASVRPRTELVRAERQAEGWRLTLLDHRSRQTSEATARILVNAAGPWVAEVLNQRLGRNSRARVRLVRGSHLVTRRLFDHGYAYLFQNRDKRVIFAIPYETDFTLIGTTDADHQGDPGKPAMTAEEEAYLLDAVSAWFATPVTAADVVHRFSGIRPLYDDGKAAAQETTRDFVLDLDAPAGSAPLLSVFGGKITTFRHLAEEALARLGPLLPPAAGPAWTRGAPLPGGDFPPDAVPALVADLRRRHPFLPEAQALRLVRAYGTDAARMLEGAGRAEDLGPALGAGLTGREVDWLVRREYAMTAEDILWRRSKLGLRLSPAEVEGVQAFLAGLPPDRAAA